MILKKIVVGPLEVNCFIIAPEDSRHCAVIDPGDEADKIFAAVENDNLIPDFILLTHGHFDHLSAVNTLKQKWDVSVLLHEADQVLAQNASTQAMMFGMPEPGNVSADTFLHDGGELKIGKLAVKVLHTPGHSPGNVTFQIENHLFVGDLIFRGSIGRTDLPGGNYEQLIKSVKNKIFALPDSCIIHPGHGPDTTVGQEKENNPFF
ncbi:MAG: MBL fold metallo-hydrolase [Calditrichaeota bacterium]|nr:MBL fold metallo-hydrolase [Calditrichota bacterium]